MWVKEGGKDLFGQLIKKNLVNEGWKSAELHAAIQKLSRTLLNDLQSELKAEKVRSQKEQSQRASNEKKSGLAPPRPLSGPNKEQRRPLPPRGRGPQLPEEVVKEFEDSMMDQEPNQYQNVQRVTPLQKIDRTYNSKNEDNAATCVNEKEHYSVDDSIFSDVSYVIDVQKVPAKNKIQEEHVYESLENLNAFDLKTAYQDDSMKTAKDIQEDFYIEPLPAIGRCKVLFNYEGKVIILSVKKISFCFFKGDTISMFKDESLLILEEDMGDGWTK